MENLLIHTTTTLSYKPTMLKHFFPFSFPWRYCSPCFIPIFNPPGDHLWNFQGSAIKHMGFFYQKSLCLHGWLENWSEVLIHKLWLSSFHQKFIVLQLFNFLIDQYFWTDVLDRAKNEFYNFHLKGISLKTIHKTRLE